MGKSRTRIPAAAGSRVDNSLFLKGRAGPQITPPVNCERAVFALSARPTGSTPGIRRRRIAAVSASTPTSGGGQRTRQSSNGAGVSMSSAVWGRCGVWLTSRAEFATTAKSFENPDWPDVTVHSYRVRWGEAEKDPRYAKLDVQAHAAQSIGVPTLMIQGGADSVTLAETTAGKGPYFTGGYARHVLDGVRHFPTREAADRVNKLLLEFLQK